MRFFAIFKLITITISTITARPFDLRADFNSLSSDTIFGSSPNSPDHFRTNDIGNGNFMQETPVLLPRHPNGGLEFFCLRKVLKSRNPWRKNQFRHIGGQWPGQSDDFGSESMFP